jgi:basic amino acid/polyamine antiporter, APA family
MNTVGSVKLRRAISLPWLVFYGVGVTVGAGIFALIGDVLRIAGDHAVWSFAMAGLVAAITGYSYVLLAGTYPKAAGEAVFVKEGLGRRFGQVVGIAIVIVAITSSAVIALAFARYLSVLIALPQALSFVGVVLALSLLAMAGVRESVVFAGLITLLEVGTLLAVVGANAHLLQDTAAVARAFSPPASFAGWQVATAGAFLAFFAFIGFEDIENMAEETHDPHRTVPLAIVLTLLISVAVYAAVALVAVAHPDRAVLIASKAPLADLYAAATGRSGATVAAMASIAMVNGVLVQIVMASRVLYGMASEAMVPGWLGQLHKSRQTPVVATAVVAVAILALGLTVPFLALAEATSLVMLLVFGAVNTSLFLIGRRTGTAARLRRWRYWGLLGAAVVMALVAVQILT